MKEYDRKLKKWVEVDKTKGSLKKSKLCKGNRPHQFELCIPDYITNNLHIEITPDLVVEYYAHGLRVYEFIKKENEYVESLGLGKFASSYNRYPSKHLVCKVCGKKDYVYEENP